MEITERTVGDVTILDLRGELQPKEPVELLKNNISSLLSSGKKKLVLNLERARIPPSTVGTVIRAQNTVEGQGGSLKLLKLTHAASLLSIAELQNCFETFNREEAVIESFQR